MLKWNLGHKATQGGVNSGVVLILKHHGTGVYRLTEQVVLIRGGLNLWDGLKALVPLYQRCYTDRTKCLPIIEYFSCS